MHHALLIPELVHEILQHVSKEDLGCHVSTVCKGWFDVSAKIIWRTLHDLTPLLRLIGEIEMQDDGNTFVDICKLRSLHEDWTRFDFYSRHVRILDLSGAETDYRPALSAIAMLRSGTAFLPHLQKFKWCGFEDWMPSVFIMHRSVTTFYLRIEFSIPEDGYVQVGRYFDFIADRMPELEHFHISMTDSEDRDISQFSQALELLVPRLTNLKSIQFPAFNNTYPIISASSSLSRLTDIRIEFCPPDTPLPSSGPPCILPSRLGILHVSMTFRDAAGIFHTALPHLLEIQLISWQAEVPSMVSHLARAISQNCRNLHKLHLYSPPARRMIGVADDCVAIADIAPLFSCSAMREFTIRHAYPLSLHDSDIQTLLTRWPALENLKLNNTPSSLLARGVSVPLPKLSTLALFARYGKHLSSLGLYMDRVANVPDIRNSCPFTHLEVFHVGKSPAMGTPAGARFLSYILPPGCKLFAHNVGVWEPAMTLMSEFRKAREEEREARSDLEREVMKLRARLVS